MNNSIISIGYWNLTVDFSKKKTDAKKWQTHTIPPEVCTSYDYNHPNVIPPKGHPPGIFTRSPATVVAMLKTKSLSWRKDWSKWARWDGVGVGGFWVKGGFWCILFFGCCCCCCCCFFGEIEMKHLLRESRRVSSFLFVFVLFVFFFF